MNLTDIRNSLSYYLFNNLVYSTLTATRKAEIDFMIKKGLYQFYIPPTQLLPDSQLHGHEWTFLKPTVEITTTASDAEQDLPTNVHRVLSHLEYPAGDGYPSVPVVSEGVIRDYLTRNDQESRPQICAIRPKISDGGAVQDKEIMWYPIPDDTYTFTARVALDISQELTDAKPEPYGATMHGLCIEESCLAIAELTRADIANGPHMQKFVELLGQSVRIDKKNQADFYGKVGDVERFNTTGSIHLQANPYPLTIDGTPV